MRRVLAYVFCAQEGLCSTFLQSPVLPTMQEAAHKADKQHKLRSYGYIARPRGADDCDKNGESDKDDINEEIDEMTTNITSECRTKSFMHITIDNVSAHHACIAFKRCLVYIVRSESLYDDPHGWCHLRTSECNIHCNAASNQPSHAAMSSR